MKSDRRLLFALATGPAVWLLTFGADVSLSDWPCRQHDRFLLYVLSALALALTSVALLTSVNQWRLLGKEGPAETGGPGARLRTMVVGGIGLNAFIMITLIAQTIPIVMLQGCE